MSRKSRAGRPRSADDAYASFMPNQARSVNFTTELMYERVLSELSLNRFKWTGLPPGIDERFIELTLFRQALVLFLREEKVTNRFFALKGAAMGRPNMYDNPTQFQPYGLPTAAKSTFGPTECVPIWSNYLRQPDHDIVYLYASKLAMVSRTIDINLMSMRQTQIIFASEDERLSMMNIMRQYNEGEPMIAGTNGMSMDKIQVFNLGIDKDQVKNLMDVKARMWNEAMTLLGINNSNQDKRERLVVDEVSANDDQVASSRSVNLKARKQACEQINALFGLSVSVDWDETATLQADAQAGRLGM